MSKCYFEDAQVGYVTEAYEYHVSAEDIVSFAKEWDPLPFHIDPELAKDSPYGGLTASGAHIYAIFVKLAHMQPRKMAVIAALGVEKMKFSNPVRPGDILHLHGECIESRELSTKSDRGISTFNIKVVNQDSRVVLELTQPIMLAKRASNFDVFSRA